MQVLSRCHTSTLDVRMRYMHTAVSTSERTKLLGIYRFTFPARRLRRSVNATQGTSRKANPKRAIVMSVTNEECPISALYVSNGACGHSVARKPKGWFLRLRVASFFYRNESNAIETGQQHFS
jgi:hypothetical protein